MPYEAITASPRREKPALHMGGLEGGFVLEGAERPASRAIDVLVLREDAESGQALADSLTELLPAGSRTSATPNGFEALIEIGERRPDVLITDLGVAGLDFFRMVHFLRDHARERLMVVVLVASEADRAGVRERLPEDVAVLGLPAESANLAARVWALLKDGP